MNNTRAYSIKLFAICMCCEKKEAGSYYTWQSGSPPYGWGWNLTCPSKWIHIEISGPYGHPRGFLCEDCQRKKVCDLPPNLMVGIKLWDIEVTANCNFCKSQAIFAATTDGDSRAFPELSRFYGQKERITRDKQWAELEDFNYLLACDKCMDVFRTDMRRMIKECTSR